MSIREEIEARENAMLDKAASLSSRSRGREIEEEPDPVRTCFMLDRDRVVHSKSFRRLKHKTQVFIAPPGDHYRSRLTHTLEVNQIAKTIGAGLNLNLDLIEAMALAHDLGHTPFAHAGEQALDQLLVGGFRHNENSIRVLTRVEQHKGRNGLNLSYEVLDGVLHHSGYGQSESRSYTLEGQTIRLSDKIAYVQHDIDDSIRAGLLRIEDIPADYLNILGYTHSQRIATLVTDTIKYSRQLILEGSHPQVMPSPWIENALIGLRDFMFKEIYRGPVCQAERSRAIFIIELLYKYYCQHPERMTPLYLEIADREGMETAVADYISGMSDAYCISLFQDIYIPQSLVPDAGKIFNRK
ncbi:deoxyguanosinetriphosphate triphosphohydrolase [Syntrophomonas wolfei]|uniref:Deoxyguanosinetriphosphate triphosphohydrolase-like protein n=1 Tax=Syntrophomonas wolfei subsp. wolfei (strain DSM 2245B / Goettingen) TaxID=335541 RepID=Q0AWU2_SYNWW|nr:deoxyguanosinetriphosphate triphosphohydrolase [Syntrophomonas wolfei]ABI68812.1 deoxyguanosinetriphosphate triphosphohydrolase-like protein [Syntrophomonas wolfei subsp. wolfei str. Goettingen G311]